MSEETPIKASTIRKRASKRKRVEVTRNAHALERLMVEYVPITSIRPNPYNPNRQSAHDFEMLCRSIATDGFTQPIIVNRASKEIVDGEHRWRALTHLEFDEAPIVYTDMTPEQMRISTLRHNRARGTEDQDLVVELFRQLQQLGATDVVVEELMLDPVELDKLLALDGDEIDALGLTVTDDQLGPDGRGLSEMDQRTHPDLSSDERRAKEAQLARIKAEEEARMGHEGQDVFRLMLIYSGPEAEAVRAVLQRLTPEGAKEPLPAAILRLCHWAEQGEGL